MLKKVWFLLFLFCPFLLYEEYAFAFDLQEAIGSAKAGEVIHIPEGQYVGSFTVNKPVTLKGTGQVVLTNKSADHTLILEGNNVRIVGIIIVQENERLDSAAVHIKGNKNVLTDLHIRTSGMGIVLEQSDENSLNDIMIEGPYHQSDFEGSMMSRQGNGIDLFQSNSNILENIRVQQVQDGVYIESSEGNQIQQVKVTDSRYGFHLMFTQNTSLLNNTSENNLTGAMIMETYGTKIRDNKFRKQSKHVHSQGLMLFNVHDAEIVGNIIEENLIGLYIESSSNNKIDHNRVYSNYIGLDVQRSNENEMSNNDFVSNVISARAVSSSENTVTSNFWDEHLGFDTTGDEVSELFYYVDPIFISIVNRKPAYQLFADAPGLLFLQMLLDQDRGESFADIAPRMSANYLLGEESQSRNLVEFIIYCLAIILCLFIIFIGVKRR